MKTLLKKKRASKYDLAADLERIKNAFMDTGLDVKGRAGEMCSQVLTDAKDKSFGLKDDVEHYTNEKPFKTIGLAIISGLLIGYLIHK